MTARPHMASKTHIVLGLSVLAGMSLIAAVFGGNSLRIAKLAPTPQRASSTSPDRHDVLGANVTADTYTLAVTKIDQSPVDPATQTQRTAIGVSITNSSSEVLQISPGLQFTLSDATGKSYPATARYLQEGEIVGGPVNPGKTTSLSVDFELPDQTKPNELIFQKDASSAPSKVKL